MKHYIKYISKDICQITKKRFLNQNKNKIRTKNIKPTLDIIQSNNNTKHRYTESKLCHIDINKILLSENEIKYETNNYIYLKKCHFRRRLNEDDKYDDEEDINRRAFTCEIMRKIRFNTDKRQLTPDTSKRHNIIKNPNLKIVKLMETQYLRNNKKNNKLKEKSISQELINNKDNLNCKNNRYINQRENSNSNETRSNRQNHFINNNHNYKYSNNIRGNKGRYNKINNNIRNNNNKNNNNQNEMRYKKNNTNIDNYNIYYSYYNNKKK